MYIINVAVSFSCFVLDDQNFLLCNTAACAEQAEFPSAEQFNYLLDVLNNGSASEDNRRHINTNYNDQDRYEEVYFWQYLEIR
jgi:hypothetical protein